MSMFTTLCLYVYLGFFGGVWLALFVRHFLSRKLIKQGASFFRHSNLSTNWDASYHGFWPFVGQTKRIRLIKKHLHIAPTEIQRYYMYYILVTRTALIFIALLILFTFSAHKLCG